MNLSEGAYGGWWSFADSHGTTLTALLEVIGLELAAGGAGPLDLEQVAARARELSQQRKRRRPNGA